MAARVDPEKCDGCGSCVSVCAAEAIWLVNEKATVDEEKCIECGHCIRACPNAAIEIVVIAMPVESASEEVTPADIVHLDARPVLSRAPKAPVRRPSGEWLGIVARVVGGIATLLLDRATEGRAGPRTGERPARGSSGRQLRRRKRSGR